jgi:glucose/arabinose dehydrogenase
MGKRRLLLISLFFLVAGCSAVEETGSNDEAAEETGEAIIEETENEPAEETAEVEENEGPPEAEERNEKLTVLAENLTIPWSIEKEKNTFYITEREGTIAKIENGEVERQAVQLDQELSTAAEAGLLGLVLDPNFEENREAVAYYTYEGNAGPTNRIIRLVLEGNEWTEQDVLLDDIPSGAVHHGGRLAIGPDDKLYATTGDAFVAELAQDLDSIAGKILRMNLDGSIPEDNPFENSYIYSYGHRNAQGLTWLDDGTMYASEHGNQAHDEINRIEPGQNYGWPLIEGEEETDELVAPVFTSGSEETWAPSGMAAYNQSLYVAGLRGQAVYLFDLETGDFNTPLTDFGRIRDIYIEDDYLYFITNNTDGRGDPIEEDDRLMRIGLTELE